MLETEAGDTHAGVVPRSYARRNPVRIDQELLVWPVVAGLIAISYSLTISNLSSPPGAAFLEGVLLVQTVVLTVAVALVAIVTQNSSAEIRLLMRIRPGGVRLLFVEFIAGIAFSVVGIVAVLTNVSSTKALSPAVIVGVSTLLFVSIALLVVSLLVLLRRITPERLVRALIAAADDLTDHPDRLDRWMAEVEAYGGRLVEDSDLNAFRGLTRGVADQQIGVEFAQGSTAEGEETVQVDLASALASVQVRLLVRAQGHSLFGQAVVRELYRGSAATRTRMEEVLLRVTNAEVLDRDLVVEVLHLGSHLGPNKQFWSIVLKALLSPNQVAIWDDRFVQPLVEQVIKRRISGLDLHHLMKSVAALPSVTPDRLASFVNRIDVDVQALRHEAKASPTASRASELLQEQVCMLRPRVLRGLVEEQAAGDLRQNLTMLVRKTWDMSGAIGKYFEVTASGVARELKLLDGDAEALFALIVLSHIGSRNTASESREAVERQLTESVGAGDLRLMVRLMEEQFNLAESSAGSMGSALSQRLWQTRLAGLSAGVHVLWACKALGKRSHEVGPGSLGYVKEATNTLRESETIDHAQKILAEFVERSLVSLAARLPETERLTNRERKTAFEVLDAAMSLAARNHERGAADQSQRRSIARSLGTIAASLDISENRMNWMRMEGGFAGTLHVLDLQGLAGDGRPSSPAAIARLIESLYSDAGATP